MLFTVSGATLSAKKLTLLCKRVEAVSREVHVLMRKFKRPQGPYQEWQINVGRVKDTIFLV